MSVRPTPALLPAARPPAVAGAFYPGDGRLLEAMVDELLANAARRFPTSANSGLGAVAGILVPHAGLVYSGGAAAAGWRSLLEPAPGSAAPGAPVPASPAAGPAASGTPAPRASRGSAPPTSAPTIVLLGTNHGAGWLDGVGAWVGGAWETPLGDVALDVELTGAVLRLGAPFEPDSRCHLEEHSLEVQLPLVRRLAPGARIVPLSVGAGRGPDAVEAGERLGALLATRRRAGEHIVLAISSDMAHYPAAGVAEQVTARLLPPILERAPEALAELETAVCWEQPGVSCGMCGIEPAVLGLAALRAMGAGPGVVLASATSADAGGDPRRTVGYLAVAFPA